MKRVVASFVALGVAVLLALSTAANAQRAPATPYVPTAATWERRAPAQVGMDATKLDSAIAFAKANETRAPRDLEENHYQTFGREPFGNAILSLIHI